MVLLNGVSELRPGNFTACWVGGSLTLTEDLRMFIALVESANCRFIGCPLPPSLEGFLELLVECYLETTQSLP